MGNIKNIQELKNSIIEGQVTLSLLDEEREKYSSEQFALLNEIIKNKDDLKKEISGINLVVLNERIPYKEFKLIKEFYKQTKDCFNTHLSVTHTYVGSEKFVAEKLWDIETIVKANNSINEICKYIQTSRMSPAEIVAYVHLITSSIADYKNSEQRTWSSNDQFFAGAFMKNPEFVCAGCASLFKEIIDTLDMPELKCNIVSFTVTNTERNEESRHCRLLLHIVDPKYHIDNEFYDDPTWDFYEFEGCYRYSNMFLPDDIHEDDKTMYDFSDFALRYQNGKSELMWKDFYPDTEWRMKDGFCLEQTVVEKIVFNALSNIKNKSFEDAYRTMQEMAQASFFDQSGREYKKCSLQASDLSLTKKQAKQIYSEVNKISKNTDEDTLML